MKSKIKVGDLRSVLWFQHEQETANNTFGTDIEWCDVFMSRGNIRPTSGLIWRRDASQEPGTTHVVTIRYDERFKRGQRIRCEGVNYTVHKAVITEHHRRRYLELHCEQEEFLV